MHLFWQLGLASLAMVATAPAAAAIGLSFSVAEISISSLGGDNYNFEQLDFEGGGRVTGTFTGVDSNGDLQLNAFDDEITDFTMRFSGSGSVPAFTLGFADLFGLVYDLDGGPLGDFDSFSEGPDFEGIEAGDGRSFYVAGPGPFIEFCGEENDCAVVLSVVPEPASWAMLIAGFGLTGAAMRRRRYDAV